jgi:hypothetical protein
MRATMKYFYLEPEVAGNPGEHTVFDRDFHPPIISKLHFELDTWSGDVLLESFPCWIITLQAAEKILSAGLTGMSLGPVEITTSELFRSLYKNRALPRFVWLKITGDPGTDDFGVTRPAKITEVKTPIAPLTYSLVVSERALRLLKMLGIEHADISEFRR